MPRQAKPFNGTLRTLLLIKNVTKRSFLTRSVLERAGGEGNLQILELCVQSLRSISAQVPKFLHVGEWMELDQPTAALVVITTVALTKETSTGLDKAKQTEIVYACSCSF